MDQDQILFFSDLHFHSENEDSYQRFKAQLENKIKNNEIQVLVFLGDIFDLWIGPSQFYQRKFSSFLKLLELAQTHKIRTLYFEGNHDLHLKKFLKKYAVEVYTEPTLVKIKETEYFLEHGDQIDKKDKSYLRLRGFLRSALMRFLIEKAPGSWVHCVAKKLVPKLKNKTKSNDEIKKRYQKLLLENTKEQKANHPKAKYFISGHMHYSFEKEINDYKVINLGFGNIDGFAISSKGSFL